MSHNETAIFSALIGFGIFSGVVFGAFAAKKSKGLEYGLLLGLLVAIGIPSIYLFVVALFEVWPQCSSIWEVIFASFGVTFFYGLGVSLVSGTSSLIASSASYLILKQCVPNPRK